MKDESNSKARIRKLQSQLPNNVRLETWTKTDGTLSGRFQYRYQQDGKRHTETIGGLSTPISRIYQFIESRENPRTGTVEELLKGYRTYCTTRYDDPWKRSQQVNAERRSRVVCAIELQDGDTAGDIDPIEFTNQMATVYVQTATKGGIEKNRQMELLRAAINWGRKWGKTDRAPLVFEKRKERPRQRYVTEKEYDAVYRTAPARIQVAMELSYLCGMRRLEILSLNVTDVLEQGIRVARAKGSRSNIILWTERLRKAVDMAAELHRRSVPTLGQPIPLIRDRDGLRVSDTAFKSAWRRLHDKLEFDWTFHDLKRRAISDHEGDKQAFSGHKEARMLSVYDVSEKEVEATR